MKIATVEECQRIDELSQRDYDLSSEVLMEAAGTLSARAIGRILAKITKEIRSKRTAKGTAHVQPQTGFGTGRSVLIVCGPGNNGADGLVVARHLAAMSLSERFSNQSAADEVSIEIVLVGEREKSTELYSHQLKRCSKQKITIQKFRSDSLSLKNQSYPLVVVDAIFGIGLNREVTGDYRSAIEAVNVLRARGAIVVSLDVPSGLDADRGVAQGVYVRANHTLSFGPAKRGFFVSDGPDSVGRLSLLPIGFPGAVVNEVAHTHVAITATSVAALLPNRSSVSNKSSHGHAALLAGRSGMWGAAVLASSAAYRMGAGYVTLASHVDPSAAVVSRPEVLTALSSLEKFWTEKKWKSIGVGPGLGASGADGDATEQALRRLYEMKEPAVVIDADAITVIAERKLAVLQSWILTPHAGELSRLMGVDAKRIEKDRFHFARKATEKLGCLVLLKGFRTVVAGPDQTAVILAGNAALAKAGTGDVLTGIIASLLAQGLSSFDAATCGAYVHGRIADDWLKSGRSDRSLLASDLIELLPQTLCAISES